MKHELGYVPPDCEHLIECDWLECEAGCGIAGSGICYLKGEWWKKKCKQFKKDEELEKFRMKNKESYIGLSDEQVLISYYQKLLLEAREFVIDAHGAWETSQGEYIVSEVDKLIEWDKKGKPYFK